MKIALLTGGQPRFTPDFVDLMNQLKGFDSADIYMTLWKSNWAMDEATARAKIETILLPQYRLAKIQLVDEPVHELPPHPVKLDPPQPENIRWWYDRIASQLTSITMAYDLIDQDYDAIIRFRLDGQLLSGKLDIGSMDLKNYDLIFPMTPRTGPNDSLVTDQFVIGNRKGMNFYCGTGREFKELIPVLDPKWYEIGGHPIYPNYRGPWGPEYLLDYRMRRDNINAVCGNYHHTFNMYGRSRFTDKHYHHLIVPDPTEK
jgi:hypothetical protein